MRILYLTEGTTGHDQRFLRAMLAGGHDVWFACLPQHQDRVDATFLPDRVIHLRWTRRLPVSRIADVPDLVPELRSMLDSVRPDVVHAGPVTTMGYLAALAECRPLLVMSWGSDLLEDAISSRPHGEAAAYAIARADALLDDNSAVTAVANRLGRRPSQKLLTIPWGTDVERFRPGDEFAICPAAWNADCFVFIATRSWEPIYGIETLVEAFATAQQRRTECRLLLLGGGSLAPRIGAMLRELGLQSLVHCPGRVDHESLPRYFRAADAYVSAARIDGTSVSLLEALSTGLPTIVTDIPSNREWVTTNVHGFLAAADDPGTLAEAMVRCASLDPATRAAIGRRNRDLATARADWRVSTRRLLAFYDEVRADCRAPA